MRYPRISLLAVILLTCGFFSYQHFALGGISRIQVDPDLRNSIPGIVYIHQISNLVYLNVKTTDVNDGHYIIDFGDDGHILPQSTTRYENSYNVLSGFSVYQKPGTYNIKITKRGSSVAIYSAIITIPDSSSALTSYTISAPGGPVIIRASTRDILPTRYTISFGDGDTATTYSKLSSSLGTCAATGPSGCPSSLFFSLQESHSYHSVGKHVLSISRGNTVLGSTVIEVK